MRTKLTSSQNPQKFTKQGINLTKNPIHSFVFFIGFIGLTIFTTFSMIISNTPLASATSSDTTVQLDVSSVINISTPDTATLECSSDTSGSNNGGYICSTSTNITVNTNNVTGYTLYMNATSGYSNSLTHATISSDSGSNTPTIPTLSGVYTPANFPVNYWGYTGGSDQSSISSGYNCTGTGSSSSDHYCPILAYNSDSTAYAPNHVINATSTPSISSTIPITYLAKVNNVKESGEYSTSLTYTAIANYVVTPITNGMFMQDIDTKVCNDTPLYSESGTIYTVVDSRDRTNYTVAKLADGNCWMTQNLELGEYGKPMTLTVSDSNVGSSGYTLIFDYANSSVYKGNSNHYGNYYNWMTVTAGSGTTTAGEDASYSVCPKNWRLPSASSTGVTDSEFYKMLNRYITTGTWDSSNNRWTGVTTSQFTNAPVSLVFSGLMNSSGTLSDQGSDGRWWSSTSTGSSHAFSLLVNTSGYVLPWNNNGRSYGFAARCLVPSS